MKQPMSLLSAEKRRLFVSAAFNVAGHCAGLVLAFVVAPLILAALGDRRYGMWAQVDSVLAYLLLFEGGVGAAVVRYVSKFEELRDQDSLNRVFSTTFALLAAAGLVVLAIALTLAFASARPLGVPVDLVGDVRWLLVMLGGNLAVALPLGVFPAVLDGLGQFPAKITVRSGVAIVQCVVVIVVLQAGFGLRTLAGLFTAFSLMQHLLCAVVAWRCLPGLRFYWSFVDRKTVRLIRGLTVSAFLVMVATRVSFQSDSLVIGAFVGLEAVTFFALASKLTETAKALLRSAFGVMTPAVSKWEARGDGAAIRRAFLDGTRYTLYLVLPVQIGFFLLGHGFLALWVGHERADHAYLVLVVLAAPLALSLMQAVASRILYGIGRLKGFAAVTVAEAAANLALSLALIGPLGIVGVALGTAVPTTVSAVVTILYVCRTVQLGTREYAWQALLEPTLAAAALALLWILLSSVLPVASWPAFVALGVLGSLAYALLAAHAEWGLPQVIEMLRQRLARRERKAGRDKESPRLVRRTQKALRQVEG